MQGTMVLHAYLSSRQSVVGPRDFAKRDKPEHGWFLLLWGVASSEWQ